MNSRLQLLAALGVTGITLLAGCGGATFSPGGPDAGEHDAAPDARGVAEAGRDARGSTDAPLSKDAPTGWSPVCPESAPAAGSACSATEGTTCEYGPLQYDVACDTVFTCQSSVWTRFPTFGNCVPDGPNPATCPAAITSIVPGQACVATGTTCQYSAGVCTCDESLGGPVFVGDGGRSPTWDCNPGPGCPMPRPRLGTACSATGTSCTYNTCEFAESCIDGAWQGEQEACAIAG
jgi:hypothetical protein